MLELSPLHGEVEVRFSLEGCPRVKNRQSPILTIFRSSPMVSFDETCKERAILVGLEVTYG